MTGRASRIRKYMLFFSKNTRQTVKSHNLKLCYCKRVIQREVNIIANSLICCSLSAAYHSYRGLILRLWGEIGSLLCMKFCDYILLDSRKVGHFLITIQTSLTLIIDQS